MNAFSLDSIVVASLDGAIAATVRRDQTDSALTALGRALGIEESTGPAKSDSALQVESLLRKLLKVEPLSIFKIVGVGVVQRKITPHVGWDCCRRLVNAAAWLATDAITTDIRLTESGLDMSLKDETGFWAGEVEDDRMPVDFTIQPEAPENPFWDANRPEVGRERFAEFFKWASPVYAALGSATTQLPPLEASVIWQPSASGKFELVGRSLEQLIQDRLAKMANVVTVKKTDGLVMPEGFWS